MEYLYCFKRCVFEDYEEAASIWCCVGSKSFNIERALWLSCNSFIKLAFGINHISSFIRIVLLL